MLSKLTIVGLSQFQPDIWDNLNLPEGIDKEVFIDEVIRQGGEFSLLYPDADFMKYQIGVFSRKWYHNFERWITAYNFEYEALFNLDVKATIEEVGTNKEVSNKKGTSSNDTNTSGTTTNHNNTETSAHSSGENTNTKQKAAYDSGSFQNTEKEISGSTLNSNGGTTENGNTSNNQTTNITGNTTEDATANQEHKIITEEYRRGNQGVTMSQQMLLAEYNAWRSNIYVMMAEVFISEFCICIYN